MRREKQLGKKLLRHVKRDVKHDVKQRERLPKRGNINSFCRSLSLAICGRGRSRHPTSISAPSAAFLMPILALIRCLEQAKAGEPVP